MTVKVIVTDMDGTFLNDAKKYDHARFMAQYHELKKRNIEFVVASGNQYFQLISFFPNSKTRSPSLPKTARWCLSMANSFFMANSRATNLRL